MLRAGLLGASGLASELFFSTEGAAVAPNLPILQHNR